MKILLEDIRLASGINQLEAERALGTVLGFLSSRLPSPVMGRIYGALSEDTESKRLGNAAIWLHYTAKISDGQSDDRSQ